MAVKRSSPRPTRPPSIRARLGWGITPKLRSVIRRLWIDHSQGVFEVATMTGTHLGPWNGLAPTAHPIRTTVLIHLPWDRAAAKFSVEKIYVDAGRLVSGG